MSIAEKNRTPRKLILGLDLGPASVGWALIQANGTDKLLLDNGVRIFEAGLDDLEEKGKGVSRNVTRRSARLIRRGGERTTRRMLKLLRRLQRSGLCPDGTIETPVHRHEYLMALDARFGSPYELRLRALTEKLHPHEIGRAIYHLAQRRGFLSNRKSAPKEDEKKGIVNSAIDELKQIMTDSHAETLGAHFAGLIKKGERVRSQYTARDSYKDEFDRIWERQKEYHQELLTDSARKQLRRTVFHQRPLKSQKHLVGRCELEETQRRAPKAHLDAQRFRYLQRLVDLTIIDKQTGEERPLTDDEFQISCEFCERHEEVQFTKLRRELGLPGRSTQFNLENGGEKKIYGNVMAARLRKAVGEDSWKNLDTLNRHRLLLELRTIDDNDALKKRLQKNPWSFEEATAEHLSKVRLEDGYLSFSLKAIQRLSPELEKRTSLQTIIRKLYPQRWERSTEPLDYLPPMKTAWYRSGPGDSSRYRPFAGADEQLGELRNPVVERTLAELRLIVNSLIRRYGKPDIIRIELGRELRQTPKQREATWKNNRTQEKARNTAADLILKDTGREDPSREDILKVLLADECEWTCPYTGKKISMTDLVGPHPKFDIEHIIPFKRCLDDSFMNKTLCWVEENRNVKSDKTPYEAYHGAEKWNAILQRVGKFTGRARREKLRRFKLAGKTLEEELAGFTNRQLNDMRWASRMAKRYVGLLYGGVDADGIDSKGKRRVHASSGKITADLRRLWGLNSILGDGYNIKSRDDHRHHAVDAVVIALSDASMVKRLNDAAARASRSGKERLYARIHDPWPGFRDEVSEKSLSVVTSHKIDKRVRGALHEETFYGKPRQDDEGKTFVHSRIPVEKLNTKRQSIEHIVDPVVRERFRKHLDKHDGDLKKAFGAPENLPDTISGNGKIRRVRIRRDLGTFSIGNDPHSRHVKTDRNHHIEVVAILDANGKTKKWEGHVVSLLEAYQRRRKGEPIIKRDHGDKKDLVFSLANREVIELDSAEQGEPRYLFVVRTVSEQLRFVHIEDARTLKDIGKKGLTAHPDSLRMRNCIKVLITPLGEVRRAND